MIRTFLGVQEHHADIFNKYCYGKAVVQDCDSTDLNIIYNKTVPSSFWFNVGAMMEGLFDCSGLDDKLERYYFTTGRDNIPSAGCRSKFTKFIDTSFSSFTTIAIVSIIVLIMLFLDVMAGCCLCCHSDRNSSYQYTSPYNPM
eukprot:TRINITY_DN1755_c0_g1_i4.p2 TRINITY_DN1755_c0_g1~~TRINITY_DN1755_c0_g1_i4.p2  ORF type:complete len:143 (+),score=2.30 TRINITY_DN1755_c0_g1_i4:796-1224(+)